MLWYYSLRAATLTCLVLLGKHAWGISTHFRAKPRTVTAIWWYVPSTEGQLLQRRAVPCRATERYLVTANFISPDKAFLVEIPVPRTQSLSQSTGLGVNRSDIPSVLRLSSCRNCRVPSPHAMPSCALLQYLGTASRRSPVY